MINNKIDKILIVGYGNIAIRHSLILKKLIKKVNIKFLRSKKINNNTNNFLFDYSSAIKYAPDLIIIANPSSIHVETCLKFIDLKPIFFIEKPISDNIQKAKSFINLCNKKNITVTVGYNLRFCNSLIFFKKKIEKDFKDNICLILSETGYDLKNWRKKTNYQKTVSAQKKLGGGVMLELSHEIDYLRWIFGEIKKIDLFKQKFSKLKIDVEDYASLRIFFKKNAYSTKLFANVNLDFIRSDKIRQLTVISDGKTLKWDGVNGLVKLYTSKTNKWKYVYKDSKDIEKSYLNQWKHIIKSIDLKNNNLSGSDSLKTLSVIQKSINSVDIKY